MSDSHCICMHCISTTKLWNIFNQGSPTTLPESYQATGDCGSFRLLIYQCRGMSLAVFSCWLHSYAPLHLERYWTHNLVVIINLSGFPTALPNDVLSQTLFGGIFVPKTHTCQLRPGFRVLSFQCSVHNYLPRSPHKSLKLTNIDLADIVCK